MPMKVLLIARNLVCHERGDDRLVVRPPEFHVVPVIVHDRLAIDIDKVEQRTVFAIMFAVKFRPSSNPW